METKKAFITLLSTKDYYPSILILHRSFQKIDSKYKLLVALTENVFTPDLVEDLVKRHINYIKIPVFNYSERTISDAKKKGWHAALNTSSKINIFDLKNFDKLVYLDSDSIVLHNIDDLMEYPDGAMLWMDDPFSGMFVFSPKNHSTELYKTILSNTQYFDGDMFSNLWFHLRENESYRIPHNYFCHVGCLNYVNDVKVAHFINQPKPWNVNKEEYKNHYYDNKGIVDFYFKIKEEVIG